MAGTKYADWPEEQKARKREKWRCWKAANRERLRKRDHEYKRSRREQTNAIVRKSYAKLKATNPVAQSLAIRKTRLKQKYGITLDEYNTMVLAQENRCAICGTTEPGKHAKHWCVDHCHKTNIVRQLLCQPCNLVLGAARDDIVILQSAIDYLKRFTEK